jgi:DNA-binding transcriptional LysR family regulator
MVKLIEKTGQQSTPQLQPRLRFSLKQLEVFVAIAQGGSARSAADKVARSQSAASAALAELEHALAVDLFDRIGRRLVLNENGRALLPGALALLNQSADLENLFAKEHAAPLRLAASLTIGEYLLPHLIASWQAEHPASRVRMDIANTSEVISAVVSMEADVGFIEGSQTHPDLLVQPWLTDELIVVAAPTHALTGGKAHRAQLRDAIWILRELGSGTRQASDEWLIQHLGQVNVGFELGSTEAIKRLAAAGAGLACVSRYAASDDLRAGRLLEIQTSLSSSRRRLAMVLRKDKRLGRVTTDFMAHCKAK